MAPSEALVESFKWAAKSVDWVSSHAKDSWLLSMKSLPCSSWFSGYVAQRWLWRCWTQPFRKVPLQWEIGFPRPTNLNWLRGHVQLRSLVCPVIAANIFVYLLNNIFGLNHPSKKKKVYLLFKVWWISKGFLLFDMRVVPKRLLCPAAWKSKKRQVFFLHFSSMLAILGLVARVALRGSRSLEDFLR